MSSSRQSRVASGYRPRLGFLGMGWIGRHRLQAIARSGKADIVGIADPLPEASAEVLPSVPDAAVFTSLQDLLEADIDGVVIATPSALHADQAAAVLASGRAVFCQKPLARNAEEVGRIVSAARAADRLLAVDMSYRFTEGMRQVRDVIASGQIGDVYAADLVFHNGYGPDKPWFYHRELSGGGCLLDLGVHLVDLLFWTLGDSNVSAVHGRVLAEGKPLQAGSSIVEDYASALMDLGSGTTAHLACSWRLHAGTDAIIAASFYATRGGVAFYNVGGSFCDFMAVHFTGRDIRILSSPPDEWGGRAAVDWVRRLAEGERYNPEVESSLHVADVIDAIYRENGELRCVS